MAEREAMMPSAMALEIYICYVCQCESAKVAVDLAINVEDLLCPSLYPFVEYMS